VRLCLPLINGGQHGHLIAHLSFLSFASPDPPPLSPLSAVVVNTNQDVFEHYYKVRLARRLVSGRSISSEVGFLFAFCPVLGLFWYSTLRLVCVEWCWWHVLAESGVESEAISTSSSLTDSTTLLSTQRRLHSGGSGSGSGSGSGEEVVEVK
jgi:hypothetical protein